MGKPREQGENINLGNEGGGGRWKGLKEEMKKIEKKKKEEKKTKKNIKCPT